MVWEKMYFIPGIHPMACFAQRSGKQSKVPLKQNLVHSLPEEQNIEKCYNQ
jgi:hypothetical protein